MRTSDELDTPGSGRQPLSRRSVLKAGAHAAWIVPAVQVIGAAPAMAVSGCQCPNPTTAFGFAITAQWNEQGKKGSNKWVLDFLGQITNNSGATVTKLVVCLSVPRAWNGVHTHSTTGWTDTYDANTRIMYFTSTAKVLPGKTWNFSTVHIRDSDSAFPKHAPTSVTLVATGTPPALSSSTVVPVSA